MALTGAGYRRGPRGQLGSPGWGPHMSGAAASGDEETQSTFGEEPSSPVSGNGPALGRDKKKCSRPKIAK